MIIILIYINFKKVNIIIYINLPIIPTLFHFKFFKNYSIIYKYFRIYNDSENIYM